MGLSQKGLSRRVSISQDMVFRIETDKSPINLAFFDDWMRGLELPESERNTFYHLCMSAKRPDAPAASLPPTRPDPVLPITLSALQRQTRATTLKAHLTVAYTYGVIPGGCRDLISRAGITPAQYNAWLLGREDQDPIVLEKIAKVLKTSIAFLLDSEGPFPDWYRVPPLIADENGDPIQPIDAVYADLRQRVETPQTDPPPPPAGPHSPDESTPPDSAGSTSPANQSAAAAAPPSTPPPPAAPAAPRAATAPNAVKKRPHRGPSRK